MNYYQEKEIVTRLLHGISTRTAAAFLKKDEEMILDLIAHDLVRPSAFLNAKRTKFGIQNMEELTPVTEKGKVLFGIPAGPPVSQEQEAVPLALPRR